MLDPDRDFCQIISLVLFKCFVHKILVEGFPLDPVEGFIDNDLNTAGIREPLDNMGDQRSGQVIVHDLVIRPEAGSGCERPGYPTACGTIFKGMEYAE